MTTLLLELRWVIRWETGIVYEISIFDKPFPAITVVFNSIKFPGMYVRRFVSINNPSPVNPNYITVNRLLTLIEEH